MHKGSCLCGAVKFTVDCELKPADACHCTQCRKVTGHYLVSTDVARSALTITGEDHVRWFLSSEKVRRGFCKTCGSTLFWDPIHHDWTGIALGAFDGATGTSTEFHIFVDDRGDYYEIGDGLPQHAKFPSKN